MYSSKSENIFNIAEKGGETIRIDGLNVGRHLKQFEELSALQEESPTAWQLIGKLIEIKGWNRSVFCERTGLDNDAYYKAKRSDKSVPSLQTIIAICVSMDLDKATIEELLTAAGIYLSKAIPAHRAYMYVINNLAAEPIAARQKFLYDLGLGRLSSKQPY